MEIIAIEKKTLEAVERAFEGFENRMEELCSGHTKRLSQWLDNGEVCRLLNISKRTLQTYRDNGILPYSQINHKMFYRSSDIEMLLGHPIDKAA